MEKYDIAIIGAGVLGTSISYWLSVLYDLKICVIEKERDVAMHTSSRNTGMVHSPFHIDPEVKKVVAKTAFLGHDLWEVLAKKKNLPWKNVGKIEVSLDEKQHKILEKYLKWGIKNGISENEIELLDSKQISQKEPNVKCYSGLFSHRDVSTNYGILTKEIMKESQKNGTKILFNHEVEYVKENSRGVKLIFTDKSKLDAKLMINCSNSQSLDIAQQLGLAKEYSDLHFRGEYWVAEKKYENLANTSIYVVPTYPEYPFLNPHWIKRASGEAYVGPNAVLVPTPETYEGYVGDFSEAISKLLEMITGSARKLLLDREFLSLVSKEWLSSISKNAMIERVKQFIPKIKPEFFLKRGPAGIRNSVITPEGKFLPEAMEIEGKSSFHIINFNSPGATGAPAYSALVVKKLQDSGFLKSTINPKKSIWNFEDVTGQN